jgi:hypothetical protein
MADTPEHLAERLSEDGGHVVEFFEKLAPADWEREIYTEGSRWSVRQILAHFDVTETSITRLIKDVLAGGAGAPKSFDLDGFNERTVAARRVSSPTELLSRFSAHRQATVDLVRGMSETDLALTGRHPFLGIAPLEDIIKLIYRHNLIHLRDIRRVLSSRSVE